MAEENKINQPVEDVFSNVDETGNPSGSPVQEPTPPTPTPENINILEASLGQEEVASVPEDEPMSKPQVHQGSETENRIVGTNKILFYLLLGLIIILGAFAIWALVF